MSLNVIYSDFFPGQKFEIRYYTVFQKTTKLYTTNFSKNWKSLLYLPVK